jgi:hypothetical protein
MANNSLALLVRSPEIDMAGTLRAAAQIRQAETAGQLADLRLRQANEQQGALQAYAETGKLDALKAHPDAYGSVLQNQVAGLGLEQKTDEDRRMRNARDAQYVLNLPEGERVGAYNQLLDNAYREKRVPDLVYQRMKAMGPNAEALQGIIDQALPLAQKPSDLQHVKADDNLVRVIRDPASPGGMRAVTIATGAPRMDATTQKAIDEADDFVLQNTGALNALKQALQLNKTAYSGALAGARAAMVTNTISTQAARDTELLGNLVTNQALQSLRSTFGGNPTEGERKILLDVAGSVNQTAPVREEIFKRAQKAAEDRLVFNKQKADSLRGGTYYKPGGQPAIPPVEGQPGSRTSPAFVKTPADAASLPPGTYYRTPPTAQYPQGQLFQR